MTVDGHTDLGEFNYRPDPGSAPDVMSMPFWTLAMCTAWIAWRDPYRVARASDEWRRWQGLPPIPSFQRLCDNCEFGMFNISASPEPIEPVEVLLDQTVDAGRTLYAALGCGELCSYDARDNRTDQDPIKSAAWAGLKPLFQLGELSDRLSDIFCNIRIQREAVLEEWPQITPITEDPEGQSAAEPYSGEAETPLGSAEPQSRNSAGFTLKEALAEAKTNLPKNDQYGKVIIDAIERMNIDFWPNATISDICKMVCDNIDGTNHSYPSQDTFYRLVGKWNLPLYSMANNSGKNATSAPAEDGK